MPWFAVSCGGEKIDVLELDEVLDRIERATGLSRSQAHAEFLNKMSGPYGVAVEASDRLYRIYPVG